jgi:TonB family protein
MGARFTITIVSLILTVGCASTPRAPSTPLEAPIQLSPPDGSKFYTFPRRLVMEWSPVPGAARYHVMVDYFEPGGGWNSDRTGGFVHPVLELNTPSYTIDFVGDQPGRWRVWAVDAAGRLGEKSPWRTFTWDTRAAREAQPVRPGPDGVTPPRSVYAPNPEYPASARVDKAGGDVTLNVTVGTDGMVKDASVAKSLRPDLDEEALRTVKTWRFEPARKDGQPLERTVTIVMSFNIR